MFDALQMSEVGLGLGFGVQVVVGISLQLFVELGWADCNVFLNVVRSLALVFADFPMIALVTFK